MEISVEDDERTLTMVEDLCSEDVEEILAVILRLLHKLMMMGM